MQQEQTENDVRYESKKDVNIYTHSDHGLELEAQAAEGRLRSGGPDMISPKQQCCAQLGTRPSVRHEQCQYGRWICRLGTSATLLRGYMWFYGAIFMPLAGWPREPGRKVAVCCPATLGPNIVLSRYLGTN